MFTDYVDSLTGDRPIAGLAPVANLDGWNLEAELIEGEFSEAAIWQILQDILPILQDLHDRHEIHGDIRPANIIRQRSDRRLVLIHSNATSTPTAPTLKGSVEYAAPEQLYGEVDTFSDLYSLGMTCLHLLTQLPPFDLIDRRANAAWQDYLSQPISPGLQTILNKLIDPCPQKRYPSAAAVLQDISFPSTARHWYGLSHESKISNTTQKIASFLSSRQATTTVLPSSLELRDRTFTPKQLVLHGLMVSLGTAVGCLAGFCLFTCLSIIALTLSPTPQSSFLPATQSPHPNPHPPIPNSLTAQSLSPDLKKVVCITLVPLCLLPLAFTCVPPVEENTKSLLAWPPVWVKPSKC